MLGDFEMGEKTKEILRKPNLKKYLITWSLVLAQEDLEKISRRPEVLQRGLKYIKSTARRNALTIYRIGSLEEVTRFKGAAHTIRPQSAHPHGVAIAEAASIEEARKMINNWVETLQFGFGSTPVKNYIEYEIQPLIEITAGGKQ
jgi:hypothetical protein